MHRFLFYNKFKHCCAHHQDVTIVLYGFWYRHTGTSEWSKITQIQFYKYEHVVVKVIYMNSSGVITVYFFTISILCHIEVMFIQLLNLLKMYCV